MKKKIEIFKRKVPVLAVIMAVLIIGTASAALIFNYATLRGDVTVDQTIIVSGDGGVIPIGGEDTITFDGSNMADFNIDNGGDPTSVNMVTTLYLDLPTPLEMEGLGTTPADYVVTDTEGITVTYDVNGVTYSAIGSKDALLPDQVIPIPTGPTNTVTVTFSTDPGVVTGTYTIQVAVDPIVII